MINTCAHHEHCDRISEPRDAVCQRTLINHEGMLSIGPVLRAPRTVRELRRSPMPKAVRNIANDPIFSTSDRSLTTFLRFPPEIRNQIYSYLLVSVFPIQYGICPIKRNLVAHLSSWTGWIRHALFPAILECCRKINTEGSQLLYGRNLFQVERFQGWPPATDIWFPRQLNIDAITRLHLKQCKGPYCAQDNKTKDLMGRFPNLREADITVHDYSLIEWEAFLVEMNATLKEMRRVVLRVNVSSEAGRAIVVQKWPQPQGTWGEICIQEYGRVFQGFEDLCQGRRIGYEFEDEIDSFCRDHCVLGVFKVVVE